MQVSDAVATRRSTLILGAVCLVLELAVAPYIAFGQGRPNFLMIFAAIVALHQGGREGVIVGFVAGLLFDLSTTGPIGLMAFELTLASWLLGAGMRNRFAEEPLVSLGAFAIADLAVALIYNLAMLALGQADSLISVLVVRTCPTALLTFLLFLPFWWFLTRGTSGTSGIFLAGKRRSTKLSTKNL